MCNRFGGGIFLTEFSNVSTSQWRRKDFMVGGGGGGGAQFETTYRVVSKTWGGGETCPRFLHLHHSCESPMGVEVWLCADRGNVFSGMMLRYDVCSVCKYFASWFFGHRYLWKWVSV